MDREQIMKGLELCIKEENCAICPYDGSRGNCFDNVKKDALDLIKELAQKHEMLSESYDHLEKTKDELLSERARLTEENERLRAELEQRPPKLIITKLLKKENENV